MGFRSADSLQNRSDSADQAGNRIRTPIPYAARFSRLRQFLHVFLMPNTPSAKKYLRQSTARRERNRAQRSELRTAVKQFRTALEENPSREEADKQFDSVKKVLDQAAAKNLIHANKAARTKSRLAALKKKTCS